jgi:hypothetical protein
VNRGIHGCRSTVFQYYNQSVIHLSQAYRSLLYASPIVNVVIQVATANYEYKLCASSCRTVGLFLLLYYVVGGFMDSDLLDELAR